MDVSENLTTRLRKGMMEYCTLLIIARRSSYATAIINELKKADMIVVEGTLYPLLTRLKEQNYIDYHWEESPQGPPRKFYHLTEAGSNYLVQLDEAWQQLVIQINAIRE